ncbi:MAG: histidinol dehydrogenase, partial [Crocinitomicaceae bacterium]|nr:histidinol dehydrogenase [Crocinitomicaceae bacterium]
MKLIKYPAKKDWKELTKRPASDLSQLQAVVDEIFQEVQNNGDQALIALTKKFDKCALEQVVVPVEKVSSRINKDLQNAIDIAYRNIKTFHRTQIQEKEPKETTAGVVCWREARPIESVGMY